MKNLRTAFKMANLIGRTAWYLMRLRFVKGPKADRIATKWMKDLIKLTDSKVNVIGKPVHEEGRQTLFMSNHLSYADCIVFRSLFPCGFIASEDVEKWPVIGPIASKQNTVFIPQVTRKLSDEEKQAVVDETKARVQTMLDSGSDVVLFPEGRMTDGTMIHKFRPALFSLLNENGKANDRIVAQPVSLKIRKAGGEVIENGKPSPLRDLYAWYTNIETRKQNKSLPKHLWDALKQSLSTGGVEVDITFHEPMNAANYDNHIDMADDLRRLIANDIGVSLDIPTDKIKPKQKKADSLFNGAP